MSFPDHSIHRKAAMLASSAIVALFPAHALAQAAAPTQSLTPAQIEPEPANTDPAATDPAATDIVVTGSRISRAGFTAPTPVTTLSAAEIQTRAPSSMADVLATIPSFRPTSTPATSGVTSRGGGIITADLRGLGAPRTLVLVNGRRFVPSGTEGVVDLKLIPSLLISQVETVTGGASAAWGSDAVAGVVNFIMKDKISGIQGTLQTGISQEGDNRELRAALATGITLFDDRFHATVGGDYIKNKGIGTQYTRDWGRKEVGLISNTAYATNGLPQYIISAGVHPSLLTPGGLITSGPLRGTAFNPNGTTFQFNYGTVYGSSMIGGGNVGNNLANSTQLGAPYEATIVMGQADYEFAPAFKVFGEVNGAWSNSTGYSQQPRDAGTITIRSDNAYLPASVKAAMAANGLSTIPVGRLYNDSGSTRVNGTQETLRGVIGAKGNLGGSWKWNAYYQYGQNNYTIKAGPNNRLVANFARAIDAVVGPNGTIVCRSTLTAPTNGCLPQNIFGDGSVKVDGYSFGTARFDLTTKEKVAAANVEGDLFSTWAGAISIAAGAEYRKEQADGTPDALSQQVQPSGSIGAFQIGNQAPIHGSYDLWEVYGEAVVPLLRDSALGKSLDLNGAVRRTDYSTSGPVTTWKAGLSYQPFADLRLRGTRSRDIRAASLFELFQAGGSQFVNVFDKVLNQTVQVREVARGNAALKPERADTWTGGVIYQPGFFPGFAVSVDYYNIKIADAIGTIPTPLAVTRCDAGLTQFCGQIVYNANGTILNTIGSQLNLNSYRTSGADFEVRKDLDLGGGRLALRLLGTYVDKLVTIDAAGAADRAGKVSMFNRVPGVPHLTGNLDATYAKNDFSLNVQTRFIGKSKYNTDFTEGAGRINTINDNEVAPYAYVSLSVSQGIQLGNGRKFQVFAVVNNLLDKDPPFIPAGSIGNANETSTNPVFYDIVGRAYKMGVRFNF